MGGPRKGTAQPVFGEGFLQEGTDKLKLEERLGEQYFSNQQGKRFKRMHGAEIVSGPGGLNGVDGIEKGG